MTAADPRPLPRLLTANDLTAMLGSRSLAYRLLSADGFPAVRLGKRLFVREDRFFEWLDRYEGGRAEMEVFPGK